MTAIGLKFDRELSEDEQTLVSQVMLQVMEQVEDLESVLAAREHELAAAEARMQSARSYLETWMAACNTPQQTIVTIKVVLEKLVADHAALDAALEQARAEGFAAGEARERERCLAVVEKERWWRYPTPHAAQYAIAQAIREADE